MIVTNVCYYLILMFVLSSTLINGSSWRQRRPGWSEQKKQLFLHVFMLKRRSYLAFTKHFSVGFNHSQIEVT